MGLIISLLERWSALAKERWRLQKNVTTFWFSVLLFHELEPTSQKPWATWRVRKATLYYLALIESYKWLWEGILKNATVCDWSYIRYPPMQYLHRKLVQQHVALQAKSHMQLLCSYSIGYRWKTCFEFLVFNHFTLSSLCFQVINQ